MKGKLLTQEELIHQMEAVLEKIKNDTAPVGTISWNNQGHYFDVVMFVQTINTFGEQEAFMIGELDL